MNFKFLTNNEVKIPRYYTITEADIAHALSVGREHYLNGHGVEDNPYLTPVSYTHLTLPTNREV